mgnify:CR=1 FL=1
MKLVWYIPAGMLAMAVLPLPYGYYMFLRLAVTAAAAYVAYKNFNKNIPIWGIVFIGVALLFNPLYTVHFDKALWVLIDITAAALFFINSKQHDSG